MPIGTSGFNPSMPHSYGPKQIPQMPPTGGGYKPEPLNIKVEDNPQLKALYGKMENYEGLLTKNQDEAAQLGMQRQRDLGSGIAKEAGLTGGLGQGSGMSQALRQKGLMAGQQAASGFNADSLHDARNQMMGLYGMQSNLALGTAANQLGQQHFALDSWRAQDQSAQSSANMYNNMQNMNFQNQLQALQSGYQIGGGVYGGGNPAWGGTGQMPPSAGYYSGQGFYAGGLH